MQTRRSHRDGLTPTEELALHQTLDEWAAQWTPFAGAAVEPGKISDAAWRSLALYAAGQLEFAVGFFNPLIARRPAGKLFFQTTGATGIETLAYFELVLLHAVMSYAVLANDGRALAVAREVAAVHCEETQPDHATLEPWALHAMVWCPQARPLADMMLHAHQIQQSDGTRGVASLLLADALYCLRRLNGEEAERTGR